MAESKTVCFVGGCGNLGFPMALVTAAAGVRTIIADIDTNKVAEIERGENVSPEPQTDELFAAARPYLSATTDVRAAVAESDIIMVIVGTPSKPDGSLSLKNVPCAEIGAGLCRTTRGQHQLVCISSTVSPGDVDGAIRDSLEANSGMQAHHEFGLVHCPELMARGSVVRDYLRPPFIIVGASEEWEFEVIERHFWHVLGMEKLGAVPFHRMSIPSAEIAKAGLNVAVTTKIAVANEIAWLCNQTPGADAADVLCAIGSDPRIGQRFFSAGPPDGGPCFPRDSHAMSADLHGAGCVPLLSDAITLLRRVQLARIVALIRDLLDGGLDGSIVGLAGLSYKPGVPCLDDSPSMWLADALKHTGCLVTGYDPCVAWTLSVSSLEVLAATSHVLVVMTRDPVFREAFPGLDLSRCIVLDMWGYLGDLGLRCRKYVRFGAQNATGWVDDGSLNTYLVDALSPNEYKRLTEGTWRTGDS